MNLITWLADFSRGNCVGICSALIPLILLSTTACGALAYFHQPQRLVNTAYGAVILFCLGMVLHVSSWFAIGVVTPVTFILLGLSLTCAGLSTLVCFFAPQWRSGNLDGLRDLLKEKLIVTPKV